MSVGTYMEKEGLAPETGRYACSVCGRPLWRGESVWFATDGEDAHEMCDDCHELMRAFPKDTVLQMVGSGAHLVQ